MSGCIISSVPLALLRSVAKPLAAALVVGLVAQPAHAHLVGVEFGDFYAGALHVLSAPEHAAAMVGLALLAAFHPREASRWILLGVPAGLIAGVALAAFTPFEIAMEPAIALTLILAGLVGIAARPLPAAILATFGGAVAVVHGFINAVSAREVSVDWLLYGGGIVATSSVLIILLIAAVATLAEMADWVQIAARAVSSWITAIGVMYLAVSLIA
ncbi:MAG: HupE/UreJ family protein [Pseudomonadota bacterium]